MESPYANIKTYAEAVTAISKMSDATKLVFNPWNDTYKVVAAENPGKKKVSPKRVLQLLDSNSTSSFYYWLPLMRAHATGAESTQETASEAIPGHTPTPEISALFAPVKEGLDGLPELVERLLSSIIADQVDQLRGVFAQERVTLTKSYQEADSYSTELEADIQVIVGEKVYLRDRLAANRAEKEAIEQRLGSVTEDLRGTNAEIKEMSIRLEAASARITAHEELGKARDRELDGLLTGRDALLERLNVTEKDLRELQNLREQENREFRRGREEDNERFKAASEGLHARHAAEVAALQEKFSKGIGAERERVTQLELALMEALKTAVNANAVREKETSDA
jgi:hypothetical protein